MKQNLLWKVLLIVVVLLAFLYGIVGIPSNWSAHGLLASVQERIHLGLDLRGGTHLILQVVVNDAVKADSDHAIERLQEELKRKNIPFAEISQPDLANNPDRIVIKGVPPNSSSDLPQQRRQKKWQAMLGELKTGDKVVTSGGIRGTIIALRDDFIHLRVPPDNLRIEVSRSSVVSVTTGEEAAKTA